MINGIVEKNTTRMQAKKQKFTNIYIVEAFLCFFEFGLIKLFLRQVVKNIIIFPLDFLYLCAILSQTVVWYAVQKIGIVCSFRGIVQR